MTDEELKALVASTSIPKESIAKAKEFGLAILSQDGQAIRSLNDDVRAY